MKLDELSNINQISKYDELCLSLNHFHRHIQTILRQIQGEFNLIIPYKLSFINGDELDDEYIENLFKKYHRVLRSLFFRYTSSKYTTKSHNNVKFENNK